MNCPECGCENREESSHCTGCGQPLPHHPSPANNTLQNEQGEREEKETIHGISFSNLRESKINFHINLIKKGTFFRRALALYFDLMVQGLIICLFFMGGLSSLKKGLSVKGDEMGVQDILLMTGPLLLMALIINLFYFTFFHWASGQTPGKALNNLKVVTEDGQTPAPTRAFIRWAGYLLSAMPFMLGFLLAIIDDQNQALHDKFASTYVVDALAWEDIHGVKNKLNLEHPGP